jgi:hypothetical protein
MTNASLSKLGTVLGDNTVDADAVWLEGTSHLIAALLQHRLPSENDIPSFHGDIALAAAFLENVNTGFGFNYFPFLPIGASSWYVMAGQAARSATTHDFFRESFWSLG